jgi:hypothetical protein
MLSGMAIYLPSFSFKWKPNVGNLIKGTNGCEIKQKEMK